MQDVKGSEHVFLLRRFVNHPEEEGLRQLAFIFTCPQHLCERCPFKIDPVSAFADCAPWGPRCLFVFLRGRLSQADSELRKAENAADNFEKAMSSLIAKSFLLCAEVLANIEGG